MSPAANASNVSASSWPASASARRVSLRACAVFHAGVLAQLPRSRPRTVTGHQLAHRSQKPRLCTRTLSSQLHDTIHQIVMSQQLQSHLRHTARNHERAPVGACRSSPLAARSAVPLGPVRDLVPRRCRRARRVRGVSRVQTSCVVDLVGEPAGGSFATDARTVPVNDRRTAKGRVFRPSLSEHDRSIHTVRCQVQTFARTNFDPIRLSIPAQRYQNCKTLIVFAQGRCSGCSATARSRQAGDPRAKRSPRTLTAGHQPAGADRVRVQNSHRELAGDASDCGCRTANDLPGGKDTDCRGRNAAA